MPWMYFYSGAQLGPLLKCSVSKITDHTLYRLANAFLSNHRLAPLSLSFTHTQFFFLFGWALRLLESLDKSDSKWRSGNKDVVIFQRTAQRFGVKDLKVNLSGLILYASEWQMMAKENIYCRTTERIPLDSGFNMAGDPAKWQLNVFWKQLRRSLKFNSNCFMMHDVLSLFNLKMHRRDLNLSCTKTHTIYFTKNVWVFDATRFERQIPKNSPAAFRVVFKFS